MNDDTLYLAEIIWDYMLLNQPVVTADCMLILGSRDDRVAVYAAELSKQYKFKSVVISGGISHTQDLLATQWGKQTEADHFLEVYSMNRGRGEVLLETGARNTGDNAQFTHQLLKESNIMPASLLLVTKPYMERRAYATFAAQWPGKQAEIRVSSVGGSLLDYCNDEQPIDLVINIMVGDLQRILEYPKSGLQSQQHVPHKVLEAYESLKSAGFTKHLINQ